MNSRLSPKYMLMDLLIGVDCSISLAAFCSIVLIFYTRLVLHFYAIIELCLIARSHPELSDSELEITIVRCINIPLPSGKQLAIML